MIVKNVDFLPVYNSAEPHVPKIVAAAIISDHDGVCYWLAPPNRHKHILARLADSNYPHPIKGKHGFITNEYKFVTREEAAMIALLANQVKSGRLQTKGSLCTEDLW